jgi:hypothetical protein
MDHLGLSIPVAFFEHYPAENAGATTVRKSRHARVKMPPHYCLTFVVSVFAEWGLEQSEYSSWVFRVKMTFVGASSRRDESYAQV